jgi:dolichyl-phosphate beta-glucosyltransferase
VCVYLTLANVFHPPPHHHLPFPPTMVQAAFAAAYGVATNHPVAVVFAAVALFFLHWLTHPIFRAWSSSVAGDHVSEMTFVEPNESVAAGAAAKSVLRNAANPAADGAVTKPFPSLFDEPSRELSLVVPAYNEEVRLPVMMDETMAYLESRARKDRSFTYEVIIVDDGSRDNTAKVGLAYSKKFTTNKVRVLILHENHGKGGAVRKGMMRARGKRILMVDADGATKISDLERLEAEAAKLEGKRSERFSMVVGSRHHMMLEAVAERTAVRNLLMHGFHFYVSIMCAPGINDTQCGFKLFSRHAAQKVFPSQHIERWAFDVELLYLANKQGIPTREVAVNWQEIDGSKVNLFSSIPQMARDIFSIRLCYMLGIWQIRKGRLVKNKSQ